MSIKSLKTPTHDLPKNCWVYALLWETRYGHRSDGCSGHCPNIVNRIQGQDATVFIWVVDDGREKIHSLHQSKVVANTVYPRVVGCIETDNQIFVKGLFW